MTPDPAVAVRVETGSRHGHLPRIGTVRNDRYEPYALVDGKGRSVWYNRRRGVDEQIELATHPREDPGFRPPATAMPPPRPASESARSLCETCARVRRVVSPRGSRFLLCQLSAADPTYPKYPPQPVVRCAGYHAAGDREEAGRE